MELDTLINNTFSMFCFDNPVDEGDYQPQLSS